MTLAGHARRVHDVIAALAPTPFLSVHPNRLLRCETLDSLNPDTHELFQELAPIGEPRRRPFSRLASLQQGLTRLAILAGRGLGIIR